MNGLSHFYQVRSKTHFTLCLIRGLGGNLIEGSREAFAKEVRLLFPFLFLILVALANFAVGLLFDVHVGYFRCSHGLERCHRILDVRSMPATMNGPTESTHTTWRQVARRKREKKIRGKTKEENKSCKRTN